MDDDSRPPDNTAQSSTGEEDQEKHLNDMDNEKAQDEADESAHPAGLRLAVICLALCLTVFISALSNTIISTALPTITSAFNSYNQIGWYGSGELITSCAFILPFGTAYSRLSVKWTFLASLLIYLVGSAICGSAPISVVLIVGRAISGIGQAGILGGAFIIISKVVPLQKRSLFNGLVGGTFSVASVCGPLVGGAFTSQLSWRWCFYFNLPLGVIPTAAIIFLLPSSIGASNKSMQESKWTQTIRMYDPIGTIFILGAVISLLLALQFGGTEYSWGKYRAIICFVVFGVILVLWLVDQKLQGDQATVPFSILQNRTVPCTIAYSLLNGASFLIVVYYVPIWFQSVQGDSPETSGLKQLALALSVSLSTIVGGAVTMKLGYHFVLLIAGSIFTAVGAGLLFTVTVNSSLADFIGYQILYGIGVGLGLNAATISVQTVLSDEKTPKGISAELFARQFGAALGSPIAESALSQALAKNLGSSVASKVFTDGSATGALAKLESIYGTGTPAFAKALMGFNDAVTRTFMVALILSSLTLPFGLLIERKSVKKGKKVEGENGQEGP